MRVWSFLRIWFFWSSVREGEFCRSKRRVTRVFSLLTFWPPGPLLREKRKVSSFSGIVMICFVIMNFRP